MKKTIIIALAIIAIIGGGYALKASLGYKPDRMVVKIKTVNDYFDSAYNDNMIKAGFTNTEMAKNYATNMKRKYYKQLGFDFFSEDETKQFLKDNDFVLGEASRYLKNIPEDAGKAIIHALTKIKHDAITYTITLTHDNLSFDLTDNDVLVHGRSASWSEFKLGDVNTVITPEAMKRLSIPNSHFWELKYNTNMPVYVIGGANEFDTDGMNIIDGILKAIPPKDPIVVLKVEGGYVQIAQW